jgi:uncharacterized membrane protein
MSNQPPYGNQGGYQGGYQGGGYPPPPGGGGYPPSGPTGKTKVMNLDYNVAGLLSYLLPVCCIGLVFSIIWLASEPKENRFLRFHALQSIAIAVLWLVVGVLFWILAIAFVVGGPGGMAGAGGWGLFGIIRFLVFLAFVGICVLGCVKAYQGEMWKLPIIGDIAEKNS